MHRRARPSLVGFMLVLLGATVLGLLVARLLRERRPSGALGAPVIVDRPPPSPRPAPVQQAAVKQAAVKKAVAKKAAVKKAAVKKAAVKKTAAKKTAVKKAVVKKAPAKKAAPPPAEPAPSVGEQVDGHDPVGGT